MSDLPLVLAQAAKVDTGDTAWMLTATALVLLMTIGLGLFYSGLVRAKNTLNTFMMCIADRKSTRLNSSHANISYAVFCLKKKKILHSHQETNTQLHGKY